MNDTLDQFKNEKKCFPKITAKELKGIIQDTKIFCDTQHTHKKKILGRPVINSINCHTSEISCFVEHHLQPLVK